MTPQRRTVLAVAATLTLAAVALILVLLQPPVAPQSVVDVKRARVTSTDVRPGDDVYITFDYCNHFYGCSAHLVAVVIGGHLAQALMQDTDVPYGCASATFLVFRMPQSVTGTVRADISFEFNVRGTNALQTYTTEPFTVR